MKIKVLFLKISGFFSKFLRKFYNYFELQFKTLNPYYDYQDRRIYTIPKIELHYRRVGQWALMISFNAFMSWIAFLLYFQNHSLLKFLGIFTGLWVLGGILKAMFNFYVGGKIRWIRELPRPRK